MKANDKVLKQLAPLITKFREDGGNESLLTQFIKMVKLHGLYAYTHFKVEVPNQPGEYVNFRKNSQVLGLGVKHNVMIA